MRSRPTPSPGSPSLRTLVGVVAAVLGLALGAVALVAALDARIGAPPSATPRFPPAVTGPAARGPRGNTPRALQLLRSWDRRRAAAYATARPGGVARLYLPGSPAGVADVRLAARYRDRGLRVSGMVVQVLSVAVLDERPGRWRLAVTDRLAHAEARPLHGGRTHPVPLAPEEPRRHVLELVRTADGWRMGSVRDAATVS